MFHFNPLKNKVYAVTPFVAAMAMGANIEVYADESVLLEEIVITARKRSESLQDIPESVTAFTAGDIEDARIETLRDFVNLTPNMIVRETFRSNETFLSLRGISSPQGGLPAVGFIVDGVQQPASDFVNQDLIDVESIEVLKGPQGALFGQGAIAGAVNIVTKKPSNEAEGFLKATYGNGQSYRLAGGLSGALIDNVLSYRLSGYTRDRDGLIKNDTIDELVDYASSDSLRGSILFESNDLSIQFRTSWTDSEAGAVFLDRIFRDGGGGYIDLAGDSVGIDDVDSTGPLANFKGLEETEFKDASLRVDYDLGFATITSITGYGETEQHVLADGDFTAAAAVGQDLVFNLEYINQEIRLVSNSDDALSWMIGAFYQDKEEAQDIIVGFEDATTPEFDFNAAILDQRNVIGAESWALFGQVDYDITDKLSASASLRYDEVDSSTIDKNNPVPSEASEVFDELQPKVQLTYQLTEDLLGYVTYSKGFRAGGFTQNSVFDNEVTQNYEFGFKSTLADGRATLNMSFFHVDYENQQVALLVFEGGIANRAIVNVPDTDINGLELDVIFQPTESLKINIGAGITDTRVMEPFVETSSSAAPNPGNIEGNESTLMAPFTFHASTNYSVPLNESMELVLNGSYRLRGGYYYDLANQDQNENADFVNVGATVRTEQWSVGLWGNNVTDTRFATNLSASLSRTPNMPRSYGVEASFNF